jgi:hypothetical protein
MWTLTYELHPLAAERQRRARLKEKKKTQRAKDRGRTHACAITRGNSTASANPFSSRTQAYKYSGKHHSTYATTTTTTHAHIRIIRVLYRCRKELRDGKAATAGKRVRCTLDARWLASRSTHDYAPPTQGLLHIQSEWPRVGTPPSTAAACSSARSSMSSCPP